MRNRTWSDVVMAAMIALCVAVVAEPQRQTAASPAHAAETTDVADASRSLAMMLLLGDVRRAPAAARASSPSTESATERVVANAAAAAGNAARGVEMPFFSFGGDASAE